ncbi:hypothetical protein Bca4012_072565 [Brassica carinata]
MSCVNNSDILSTHVSRWMVRMQCTVRHSSASLAQVLISNCRENGDRARQNAYLGLWLIGWYRFRSRQKGKRGKDKLGILLKRGCLRRRDQTLDINGLTGRV